MRFASSAQMVRVFSAAITTQARWKPRLCFTGRAQRTNRSARFVAVCSAERAPKNH